MRKDKAHCNHENFTKVGEETDSMTGRKYNVMKCTKCPYKKRVRVWNDN